MRAVRIAVGERSGPGLVGEPPPDALGNDAGRQRYVSRGDALRDRDQVGLDPEHVAAEPGAEPPEAAYDLVGDQQHVMAVKDLLDGRAVALWGDDDAVCRLNRLGDERGDRGGSLGDDQLIQLGSQTGD